MKRVLLLCMWHVIVYVMYPMKKSTVVVDSVACSFPLGYHFRTAPCKHFPERNQCGNLHACRYLIWYHVACTGHELHEPNCIIVVEYLQLVAFYTMVHSGSCKLVREHTIYIDGEFKHGSHIIVVITPGRYYRALTITSACC